MGLKQQVASIKKECDKEIADARMKYADGMAAAKEARDESIEKARDEYRGAIDDFNGRSQKNGKPEEKEKVDEEVHPLRAAYEKVAFSARENFKEATASAKERLDEAIKAAREAFAVAVARPREELSETLRTAKERILKPIRAKMEQAIDAAKKEYAAFAVRAKAELQDSIKKAKATRDKEVARVKKAAKKKAA